jgi:hypothetical protein
MGRRKRGTGLIPYPLTPSPDSLKIDTAREFVWRGEKF